MRFRLLFLAVLTLLFVEAHLLAKDTSSHRRRVLVISTPTRTDPRFLKQQSLLTPRSAPFRERDMVIKIVSGEFQIKLIGKDGHIALSSHEPLSQSEIFASIDAMPMRRDEIRRQEKHRKAD